ncbi:MAG: PVC-type heme-binding CxxCH protein [Limisphaerales bacterium]
MLPRSRLAWSLALLLAASPLTAKTAPSFRAGASAKDISPTGFPVRVNGMFTERSADQTVDPLFAKAIALDDGTTRMVLCVVDTCMIPRSLIDHAKALASEATGLSVDRMFVSATHTHSAPAAMGCLGSRADPEYAAYLPGRIAEAISEAVDRLAQAQVGWGQVDDWEHTFNRRWLRRPDKVFNDPFGKPTVRAHMHPGYLSPDAIAPSGPVDPQLSVLAVRHADGRPMAVLANYSMHYYDSPLLSSDYFGRFSGHLAAMLEADPAFVGIMSQGTSGDLARLDYGSDQPRNPGYDAYADEVARVAFALLQDIQWHDHVPLRMAERTLPLQFRVPDEARLAWARDIAASLGDRLPQTQPEIYALEALYLHERPQAELVIQAISIGDLGITGLPNEVYALTGLKLKRRSPFTATFNIELANGAEGYIPPPEQHHLGGYTTWPARTAGLEVQAEPRIVETALSLLEELASQPRRDIDPPSGPYAQAILESRPEAYWRLEDMDFPAAKDTAGQHAGRFEPGVALYLPGADDRQGFQPNKLPAPNNFSGLEINRAVHFAGGRMRATIPLPEDYSIEFWVWNGLPADTREVTGYAYSRGHDGDPAAKGEHLGIGGTYDPGLAGKLILFNGNEQNRLLVGHTTLAFRAWHHLTLVREGTRVRVHLDGQPTPEIEGELELPLPPNTETLFFGGRNDNLFNLEGKLDEISVYLRALAPGEIAAHYRASGLSSPVETAAHPDRAPPLSPEEAIPSIQVREGYSVELVAAEPLTLDPVAIDWDAAGRLWVVEMADYPLGMDGQGQPGGRVRILEDSDGDGRYDHQEVFAEGLNFPNGLLVWRDGVLVTAAPEILFLRDTDGDGHADSREVLVTGLTTGNQQLRANGLRWGMDGWVYCAAGGHHGEYGTGTKLRTRAGEILVGSRDFRFRPDTGELEPESGPSQFGRNRDDWGHWFGTQNSRPLWHYVLPDAYLRRNPHVPAPDPRQMVVVPLNPKVYPASRQQKRFHSFEQAGHFTSACSGMIYRDELLFETSNSEQHAFTCEPFHNLVQHNILMEDGVTFAARRDHGDGDTDFFASRDRWCRPVMIRTGPDGALWVVDMYRYMIEHPDWLPQLGREELLPNYRAGDDRGRIYRVFPQHTRPRRTVRLDQLNCSGLVAALDSSNGWQRDHAHMMLLWNPDQNAIHPLRNLVRSGDHPAARIHAVALLHQLGGLIMEDLMPALSDPHPRVRENALRIAEHFDASPLIEAASRLASDPDPKVRLQFALSAGEWNSPIAGRALARLAAADSGDPFLSAAIMSSALPHLEALADISRSPEVSVESPLSAQLVTLALSLKNRTVLEQMLRPALTSESVGFERQQMMLAERLAAAMQSEPGGLSSLAKGNDTLASMVSQAMDDSPGSLFNFAQQTLADPEADSLSRSAAARLLALDPTRRDILVPLLTDLLTPRNTAEIQQAAITALAMTADPQVPSILLEQSKHLSPKARAQAMDTLLSREPWAHALAETIQHGHTLPLDASQRSRLLHHPSARVRELAGNALAQPSSRTDVLEQFQPALQLAGDPQRGRSIYQQSCITCHKLGDTGGTVGPDLKSVASHPPPKLLANILDPSADVQPGFHAYDCELTDGTELYGLVTSETGVSITLKSADGSERTIRRQDIAALRITNLSLMPEGLETGLTPQDLADLLALLRSGTN